MSRLDDIAMRYCAHAQRTSIYRTTLAYRYSSVRDPIVFTISPRNHVRRQQPPIKWITITKWGTALVQIQLISRALQDEISKILYSQFCCRIWPKYNWRSRVGPCSKLASSRFDVFFFLLNSRKICDCVVSRSDLSRRMSGDLACLPARKCPSPRVSYNVERARIHSRVSSEFIYNWLEELCDSLSYENLVLKKNKGKEKTTR